MSLVLDMNRFAKEFEIKRPRYVCEIRRNTFPIINEDSIVKEINFSLTESKLGLAMPFASEDKGFWFYIFFNDEEKGLKLVRRILIEMGINLDAELRKVSPNYEILKEYGKHK